MLLRVAVGVTMVVNGAVPLAGREPETLRTWALCLPSIASGLALVAGLLTPAAGALAAAISVVGARASSLDGPGSALGVDPAAAFLTVTTIALTLLGPGAFSVDARLFGRREIVVPRAHRRLSAD